MHIDTVRISFSHEEQLKITKAICTHFKEMRHIPNRKEIEEVFFKIMEKEGKPIPHSKWYGVCRWLIPNINMLFDEIISNMHLQIEIDHLKKDLLHAKEKLAEKENCLVDLKANAAKDKKVKLYIAGLLPKQQQLLLGNKDLSAKCIFKFASSAQHNNTQLEAAMINSDYILLMTDFINRNTIVKKFKKKLINVNGGITHLEDTIKDILDKK